MGLATGAVAALNGVKYCVCTVFVLRLSCFTVLVFPPNLSLAVTAKKMKGDKLNVRSLLYFFPSI